MASKAMNMPCKSVSIIVHTDIRTLNIDPIVDSSTVMASKAMNMPCKSVSLIVHTDIRTLNIDPIVDSSTLWHQRQ